MTSPPCVVKSFLSQCSITYRVKYLNWSWKFVSIFLFLFYLRTRMGWIQCSVVSTRQKFVLKFYEMNMILRSLKEMEESKVSMNNFLLFIINGRRMERNFKLKRETFRKSSWKIKNCVTREDRFHLLRSKIKFPFDDTSINFYFFFFQSTLLPRSSLLSRNLSPSVRHSDFLVHFLCMREKENEKRDARFPDTQLNDDNQCSLVATSPLSGVITRSA